MHPSRTLLLALARIALLAALAPIAHGTLAQRTRRVTTPPARTGIFVATSDGRSSGELVRVEGGDRVPTASVALTSGGTLLRRFGAQLWTIHPDGDSISRVRTNGGRNVTFAFPSESRPTDVLVRGGRAYVTLGADPVLRRIDLADDTVETSVDLSPYAPPGEELRLGTMFHDRGRLLVQVQLFPDPVTGRESHGLLAVIDLATETPVDLDPTAAGLQGIELQGAPPRLRMQRVPATRTLLVSTTEGRFDDRGGIERVDLDALESTGFAVEEARVSADVGGFVLTSAAGGYFVFHTDIVPSTHLVRFSLVDGSFGPELTFLLGDFVEELTHDPLQHRLLLPTGDSFVPAEPGVVVLDTRTDRILPQIETGARAHDVVPIQR